MIRVTKLDFYNYHYQIPTENLNYITKTLSSTSEKELLEIQLKSSQLEQGDELLVKPILLKDPDLDYEIYLYRVWNLEDLAIVVFGDGYFTVMSKLETNHCHFLLEKPLKLTELTEELLEDISLPF